MSGCHNVPNFPEEEGAPAGMSGDDGGCVRVVK